MNDSNIESLSFDKQIYVLHVSSTNFFETDSILSKNVKSTGAILKNGKKNDEYSLSCRFYLENSLNGLQIEEYFSPINVK